MRDCCEPSLCFGWNRYGHQTLQKVQLLLQDRTPTLIRVKAVNFPGNFESVRTEVFLIDHSVVAYYEGHYSGDLILCRNSNEREATDHRSLHNIIHLSERRLRSLTLQHSEKVAVVGFRAAGVTAFNGARRIFTNRAAPCTVGVLPCQAVLLAGRADDLLRILIDI